MIGFKPVESGVDASTPSDSERLAQASTFHVKHIPTLRLRTPVSPHLAARLEGVELDWARVVQWVSTVRQEAPVVVELAGGLFSPVTHHQRNVDVLASLRPTMTLLLAPNRLGVLHDVGAAVTGARHVGVELSALGLVAPQRPDASTSTNARELKHWVEVPLLGVWERASSDALSHADITQTVLDLWLAPAIRR